MNFLKKAKSAVVSTGTRFNAKIAALCMFLVALAAQAATTANDYGDLTDQVVADINGMKTPLITVATALVAIAIIFAIYKFVRRFL